MQVDSNYMYREVPIPINILPLLQHNFLSPLEYILTITNLNIWHWFFQTHFILRDLVRKSVGECTVSFAIPSLYFNPLDCTLVFCLQYILELLLSKWQESSRHICSLIAFAFLWNFAGVEALSHPSSRACSSSCGGLGKNARRKSKDISQAGRYGGKLFDCWFLQKASPRSGEGRKSRCFHNGPLHWWSFAENWWAWIFHISWKISRYVSCSNSKVRSLIVPKR